MANTILPSAIVAAESLLVQVMKDNYPTEDWSPNSALRDLVVKTLAYGLAYLDTTKDYVLNRSTVAGLTSLTDADAIAAADALLSNFFITRNTGNASSGVVTVYLSSRVDVLVKSTTRFYKTPSTPYHITTLVNTVIPSTQLHAVVDGDGNETEYWFNIPVTSDATEVTTAVTAGAWQSWTPFSAYVTRIENLSDFTTGTGAESNSDFVSRARNALTVRNMVSDRSIDTVLRDNFSNITRTLSLGAGEVEQQRDKVTITDWGLDLHVLGFADTYLWLPLVEDQVYSELVGASQEMSISTAEKVVYRIKRAYWVDAFSVEQVLTYTNELLPNPGEYRLAYDTLPSLTFSQSATPKVLVGSDVVGETVFVEYDTVSGMGPVDTFVAQRVNRVLCSNHIVKAAVPVYVSANIKYVVKEDATAVLNEATVAAGVATYINTVGEELYVSNVIKYILDNWGHIIENVRTPLNLNYNLWSTEGKKIAYTTSNKVELDESLLTDVIPDPYPDAAAFSMSSRLMRFIASASGISVTQDV
jgi:hypothetical protein